MPLITGEKVRSVVTGKVYRIRLVGDRMAVLESEDKSNQVLTTTDNLKLFYEKKGFEAQLKNLPMILAK
jgi:hypothetical protein